LRLGAAAVVAVVAALLVAVGVEDVVAGGVGELLDLPALFFTTLPSYTPQHSTNATQTHPSVGKDKF